jgi:hypothetical protein
MLFHWNDCLIHGKKAFDYMTSHFERMFDENNIKHFYIRYATYECSNFHDDLNEKYNSEIQIKLIEWIKKEHESNRLFNDLHWKPFRDPCESLDMYLGYNKLFSYKGYYFQLALENESCGQNNCIYCDTEINMIHFELALYGWKMNGIELLEPDMKYIVEADNMISKSFWE